MSAANDIPQKVVPAQVDFFAIYNPSLGTTDDTFENQIVYYSSQANRSLNRKHDRVDPEALRRENNEQLRQIGLAQGMVEFGRSFSDGRSVNSVETEKSRIILHELELGWWVLASIRLTVLPTTTKSSAINDKAAEEARLEYSSREVKPAILLLGDILRAHSTFLLHHASSMSALFVRTRRSKFIGILGRYWDTFLSTWSVLMHGNPARNLYGGIKIAACGELGIGVGEEDRGSGEREVLEGLVGRIDGLVDVIVSKFGDGESKKGDLNRKGSTQTPPMSPWLGSGIEPTVEDGAVFLGTGALSRKSTKDVSHWIEDLYRWGPYTYGVTDNPTSNRRTKRSKQASQTKKLESITGTQSVPPPILNLASRDKVRRSQSPSQQDTHKQAQSTSGKDGSKDEADSKLLKPALRRGSSGSASINERSSQPTGNRFVQYMKLGYGTHWSLGSANEDKAPSMESQREISPKRTKNDNFPSHDGFVDFPSPMQDSKGYFLIGLTGDIDKEPAPNLDSGNSTDVTQVHEGDNDRVLLRTLTLELERDEDVRAEKDISIDLGNSSSSLKPNRHPNSDRTGTSKGSFESQDRNKAKKLRVVVYVNRPFIFVLLFELRAGIIAFTSLYRSLHHQISPLVKPLLKSTTFRALKPDIPSAEDKTPIYDLIWDPKLLTVTTNIPNIPDPHQTHPASSYLLPWSRIEAINTHMQIINTYISTATDPSEVERTCKTSRGWWVVWMRIPDPDPPAATLLTSDGVKVPGSIAEGIVENQSSLRSGWGTSRGGSTCDASTSRTSLLSGPAHPFLEMVKNGEAIPMDKEIFLIRRSSDNIAGKTSSRFTSGSSTGTSESWMAGPGKLVQGIGVDPKWYIDTLLNLSR